MMQTCSDSQVTDYDGLPQAYWKLECMEKGLHSNAMVKQGSFTPGMTLLKTLQRQCNGGCLEKAICLLELKQSF